jgi:hypothetical protein
MGRKKSKARRLTTEMVALRGCCNQAISRVGKGLAKEFDIFVCPDKDCPNIVWYVKGKWQVHGFKKKLTASR